MDLSISRLRHHVETRYQGELPREWTPARRQRYLDEVVARISAEIETTTQELTVHHLERFRQDRGREPSESERIRLSNSSRSQACELALDELYDGFDFDEAREEDPSGEPTPADYERLHEQRLDAQWMALSPMQRWMTPWAEDPDEDLIGLARRLWQGHDIATKMAGAHLLHARRCENLPIPATPADPLTDRLHADLLAGIAAEQDRQIQLRRAPG